MSLAAAIEELRAERAELDERTRLVDGAIGSLMALIARSNAAKGLKTGLDDGVPLAREPSREASRPGARSQFTHVVGFEDWRKRALTPIVEIDDKAERAAATRAFIAKEHTLPNGTRVRFSRPMVYRWLTEFGESEGAVVVAPPATTRALPPAPVPSKDERREMLRKLQEQRAAKAPDGGSWIRWAERAGFAAWRAEMMKPVLAHPRGSAARRETYAALALKVHTAPDGNGSGQISVPTLKRWAKELERDPEKNSSADDNSDEVAVDATPAATAHPQASQEEPSHEAVEPQEEASAPAADVGPRIRARTLSMRTLHRERTKARREGRRLLTVVADRPLTRSECVDGPRPCPFVSCKHHLYLDVTEIGSLKINFPHLEPDQMAETCALDVVDKHGARNLEEVGALLNMTKERVRQIEEQTLASLKEPARDYDLHLMVEDIGKARDPMESMPESLEYGDGSLALPTDPTQSWTYRPPKETA